MKWNRGIIVLDYSISPTCPYRHNIFHTVYLYSSIAAQSFHPLIARSWFHLKFALAGLFFASYVLWLIVSFFVPSGSPRPCLPYLLSFTCLLAKPRNVPSQPCSRHPESSLFISTQPSVIVCYHHFPPNFIKKLFTLKHSCPSSLIMIVWAFLSFFSSKQSPSTCVRNN